MKKARWNVYFLWILLVEAVGFLISLLTRAGMQAFYRTVTQPPLSPPRAVFPIVWGILYALMGFGAARVWLDEDSKARSRGLALFFIQMVLNCLWTLVFFNAAAYGVCVWILVALWAAVAMMILRFYAVDPLAGWLQVPYLVWLTFAAYLNLGIWLLNR